MMGSESENASDTLKTSGICLSNGYDFFGGERHFSGPFQDGNRNYGQWDGLLNELIRGNSSSCLGERDKI